jgi:GntR family transcriptional regulator, transcriptional repressor for pyruvate dehydrogenase complex
LILTVGALESLWSEQERRWAATVDSEGRYPAAKQQREVQAAHKALIQAIAAGNADRASKLAQNHLAHSQRFALAESGRQTVKATSLRNDLAGLAGS